LWESTTGKLIGALWIVWLIGRRVGHRDAGSVNQQGLSCKPRRGVDPHGCLRYLAMQRFDQLDR